MAVLILIDDLSACRALLESLNTSVVQTWDAEQHGDALSEATETQRLFAALKASHPPTEEGYDLKALHSADLMLDEA